MKTWIHLTELHREEKWLARLLGTKLSGCVCLILSRLSLIVGHCLLTWFLPKSEEAPPALTYLLIANLSFPFQDAPPSRGRERERQVRLQEFPHCRYTWPCGQPRAGDRRWEKALGTVSGIAAVTTAVSRWSPPPLPTLSKRVSSDTKRCTWKGWVKTWYPHGAGFPYLWIL